MPVAEQTGLIAPLGRFVLEEVCRQAKRADAELARAGARISFNVSAREFGPRRARDIAAQLEAHGVRPERLQLEITESAIMRDEQAVVAALEELSALGLSIALDDFGTGYSSLSYLRRLPVDTLKMDGSFIRSIAERGRRRAHTLDRRDGPARGLRVVAEGVEHEAHGRSAAKWGCHEIRASSSGRRFRRRCVAALSAPARRPRRR